MLFIVSLNVGNQWYSPCRSGRGLRFGRPHWSHAQGPVRGVRHYKLELPIPKRQSGDNHKR